MFKSYGRKRRIKIASTIMLLLGITFYLTLTYYQNKTNDEVIARIGNTKIYKRSIIKKYKNILELHKSSASNKITDIPNPIIKSLAKEIYIEEMILKKAKKSGIQRGNEARKKIKEATDKIIIDQYMRKMINSATSDKIIKKNYNKIVKNLAGKKDYNVDSITLSNKKIFNIIYKKLDKSKQVSISRFNYFKKNYSTQNLSPKYIMEDNLPFKYNGKSLYKIINGDKYKIFFIKASRLSSVPKYDNEYISNEKYRLYNSFMEKYYKNIIKNKKVTLIKNDR